MEITYASGPDFLQDIPPAGVLDRSFSFAGIGDGRTVIDSALGQIKAEFTSSLTRDPLGNVIQRGTFEVVASLSDTLHFVGSGRVLARISADGTALLPAPDPFNDLVTASAATSVLLAGGGTPQFIGTNPLSVSTNPGSTLQIPPNVPFPIHQEADFTFDVTGGQANDLFIELQLTGIGGAAMDFAHTVQLSFDLPPGVSVSTDGGFFQAGAPTVPEPSGLILLGSGAAAVLLVDALRRGGRALGSRLRAPLLSRRSADTA
jgi:hypothetical protein